MINTEVLKNIKIKLAIQINGKTKEIINVQKDLSEKDIIKEVMNSDKVKKNLLNKKIKRTIYVKNRIVNYLVE